MSKKVEIVRLNDRWRIVDDPLQWILEVRQGKAGKKASGYRQRSFCCWRSTLLRDIRERCGDVDPAAVAYIESWPERHVHGGIRPTAANERKAA